MQLKEVSIHKEACIVSIILLILSSCQRVNEANLFSFEASVVSMPPSSGMLHPELVSQRDYQSSEFSVLDSLLIGVDFQKKTFFQIQKLESADTVMMICDKGRGPLEMLSPIPQIDIVDGHAHMYDLLTNKYFDVNIIESIKQNRTIVERTSLLNRESDIPLSLHSVRVAGEDSLICFDACQHSIGNALTGIPSFKLFRISDGELLRQYNHINSAPTKLPKRKNLDIKVILGCHSICNSEIKKVCFLMPRFPQMNFLDYKSGEFHGFRLSDFPKYKPNHPRSYFSGLSTNGDYIFAIFAGVKTKEWRTSNHSLLIFDWDGQVRSLYELDGPYSRCYYSNGYLYLNRVDHEWKLYRIPISDLGA